MFGWDINKLVEEATALVNDAQQDIASWDLREDATDASTSVDPAGWRITQRRTEVDASESDAFVRVTMSQCDAADLA